MALELVEGFDLGAAVIAARWTGTAPTILSGRTGSKARVGAGNTLYRLLPGGAKTTRVVGIAVLIPGTSPTSLFSLTSGGSSNLQITVGHSGTSLRVWSGSSSGTVLGTSASGVLDTGGGSYNYIEVQVTINGSTGSVTAKVNGSTVLTLTGVNTAAAGGTTFDGFILNPGGICDYDDIYFTNSDATDAQGNATSNIGFLGQLSIVTLRPTGAGTNTNWTPTGVANNYDAVDDADSNSDTDYVSTAVLNNLDTYATGDLSSNGTVYGVQPVIMAKVDTAGARGVSAAVYSGGSSAAPTEKTVNTTSYKAYETMFEKNPVGAATWTQSNVNAAEFGVKLTT